MNEALARGTLLYDQKRYDRAAREFQEALVEAPDDGTAHAFLALCLLHQRQPDAAAVEAGRAIECDPDDDFVHYVASHVWKARHKHDEAMKSIHTALELSPGNAHYHGTAALFLTDRQEWEKALFYANRGIELDADDSLCYNTRALALMQLGRPSIAIDDLRDRLNDEPEDANTLSTLGWASLHKRDHAAALDAFTEALRIEPELESARTGMLHALSASYPLYGQLLRYFLWMGKMKPSQRLGYVLGSYYANRWLHRLRRSHPALAPLLFIPLLLLSIFNYLTWTAQSLAISLLSLNRRTRPMLKAAELTEARCTIALVGILGVSTVLWYSFGLVEWLVLALVTLLALMPLGCVWRLRAKNPRRIMSAATAAVLSIGAICVASVFLWGDVTLTRRSFKLYVETHFWLLWLGNALMSLDPGE